MTFGSTVNTLGVIRPSLWPHCSFCPCLPLQSLVKTV